MFYAGLHALTMTLWNVRGVILVDWANLHKESPKLLCRKGGRTVERCRPMKWRLGPFWVGGRETLNSSQLFNSPAKQAVIIYKGELDIFSMHNKMEIVFSRSDLLVQLYVHLKLSISGPSEQSASKALPVKKVGRQVGRPPNYHPL